MYTYLRHNILKKRNNAFHVWLFPWKQKENVLLLKFRNGCEYTKQDIPPEKTHIMFNTKENTKYSMQLLNILSNTDNVCSGL